jgi:hypothetical protein
MEPPYQNIGYEIRVIETMSGNRFAPFMHGEPMTPPNISECGDSVDEQAHAMLSLLDFGSTFGYDDVEEILLKSPLPMPSWGLPAYRPVIASPPPSPSSSPGMLSDFEEFLSATSGVFLNGLPMQPGISNNTSTLMHQEIRPEKIARRLAY